MANYSKCVILGNLIKDPELKNYNGSSYISFCVAVNTTKKVGENYQSDYYNVTVWGKAGEYLMAKLQKGTQVQVLGDLILQSYKDKSGQEKQSLSLRAFADGVIPLARQKEKPKRDDGGEEDETPPF